VYKLFSHHFLIKTDYVARGRQLRHQSKTYNIIISKNNIIDIFNNRIRAADAITKCLSCLIGNEATPNIWYRTTKFGNKCTKS
jgi:hypothetical protein